MKKTFGLIALSVLVLWGSAAAQLGITIDAERDDYWNTLTGPEDGHIFIPHKAVALGTMPEDDIDLSALIWMGWDEDYLYVYAEVEDDLILVNNSTKYENDGMELKIDPDPTAQTTSGVVGWRLTAWGKDIADDTSGVDNLQSNESAGDWVAVEGEDYARAEIYTDDFAGYSLEFRLPWDAQVPLDSDKAISNEVGDIFGMAINILENDDINRECALQWSAGMDDAVWSNPQLHGTVIFLEDGKLELVPVNSAGGSADNDSTHWYIPPETAVNPEGRTASGFALEQNYPNPFNPKTTIDFSVKTMGLVKLAVYDILGREIRTLVHETLPQGRYSTVWDGRDNSGALVSSGVYIYRVDAGTYKASRKLSFIQ